MNIGWIDDVILVAKRAYYRKREEKRQEDLDNPNNNRYLFKGFRIKGHHSGWANKKTESNINSDFTAGMSYDPKEMSPSSLEFAKEFMSRAKSAKYLDIDYGHVGLKEQRDFFSKITGIKNRRMPTREALGRTRKLLNVIRDQYSINEVVPEDIVKETSEAYSGLIRLSGESRKPGVLEYGLRKDVMNFGSISTMNLRAPLKSGSWREYVRASYGFTVSHEISEGISTNIYKEWLKQGRSNDILLEKGLTSGMFHQSSHVLNAEAYYLGRYGTSRKSIADKLRFRKKEILGNKSIIPMFDNTKENIKLLKQYKTFIAQGVSGKPFDLFDPEFRNFKGSISRMMNKHINKSRIAGKIVNSKLISEVLTENLSSKYNIGRISSKMGNASRKAFSGVKKLFRKLRV